MLKQTPHAHNASSILMIMGVGRTRIPIKEVLMHWSQLLWQLELNTMLWLVPPCLTRKTRTGSGGPPHRINNYMIWLTVFWRCRQKQWWNMKIMSTYRNSDILACDTHTREHRQTGGQTHIQTDKQTDTYPDRRTETDTPHTERYLNTGDGIRQIVTYL